MEFLNIDQEGAAYASQLRELYERAFPVEEKKPWPMMEALTASGKMEMLAVVQESEFMGLVINLIGKNGALLDYFAIEESRRGGGIGSAIVSSLLERFAGRKYIFEIEAQNAKAANAQERRRRKNFYIRNGLKETGVFAFVYGTDFELLTPDGELTYEEYEAFLIEMLGEDIVKIGKMYPISPEEVEG